MLEIYLREGTEMEYKKQAFNIVVQNISETLNLLASTLVRVLFYLRVALKNRKIYFNIKKIRESLSFSCSHNNDSINSMKRLMEIIEDEKRKRDDFYYLSCVLNFKETDFYKKEYVYLVEDITPLLNKYFEELSKLFDVLFTIKCKLRQSLNEYVIKKVTNY